MRLTLINPCQPYLVGHHSQAPLGLLYLSAVLKRERPDVDVCVRDCSALSIDEAVASLERADVFGFTATSLDYPIVRHMRDVLVMRFLAATIIIGGPHATALPGEVLNNGFDTVFVREAEQTILDYVDDYKRGIERNLYRASSNLDLSWLPWPDREAIPWFGGQVLMEPHGPSTNIMGSRGCPCNCFFCASDCMWPRIVRWRDPMDIAVEMKHCRDQYGIKVFRFSDDSITHHSSWFAELCRQIAPLKVSWRPSARVDGLPEDLLRMAADAGCKEIDIGVESFDPDVLLALGKGVSPEECLEAIERVHQAGIGARLLLMISTPGETYRRTVDLNIQALEALKDKFVRVGINLFRPLPGTAIWERPGDYGISIDSKDLSRFNFFSYRMGGTVGDSPISISGMTTEQQEENARRLLDYVDDLPQTRRWLSLV